ncbi:JmjC domain-containing protein [Streptomyces beijiangensis]|uniref:JmjC domain-containing protein n=1 Tax=Streptomyces beijiangensis TaxID=163361 RepID=UPI00361FF4F6
METLHPLTRLIDEFDLLGTFWNKKHGLFKNASPVAGMLDESAIQEVLDVGLLRWPYFMLLKEGIQPALTDFTRTRNVGGRSVSGFADAGKVRAQLAGGATMKLSQLEDWHLPTRRLMDEIESRLPAELKAYVFYTPCDNTGMLPHRDPSHVLALQIAGAKEWRIYDAPDKVDSRGGLLPGLDADSHSHSFVMEPGDVLYLPHGIPHVATARTGTSLHLTLTLTEPAPLELAESLMEGFGEEADRLDSTAPGISPRRRPRW